MVVPLPVVVVALPVVVVPLPPVVLVIVPWAPRPKTGRRVLSDLYLKWLNWRFFHVVC